MAETNGNTPIRGNTPFQVTVKHLILTVGAGVSALVVGLWAVITLTIGSLQSDVSDIRTVVTSNQDRNAETQQYATSADSELRAQLAELTAELRITNAGLSRLDATVAGLNESIQTVDAKLTQSVERQEAFERSMLVRMGQVAPSQTRYEIPMNWKESDDSILQAISTGDNPLVDWYKFTTPQ